MSSFVFNILYGTLKRFSLIHRCRMVGQTMLKSHTPLCWLFYLCVVGLRLFALKFSLV